MSRGRPRRKRAGEKAPEGRKGIPACPSFLSESAKSKWLSLTDELEKMGLLTISDGDIMACYCEAWASWKEANDYVGKLGINYKSSGGQGGLVYNQWLPARSKMANEMQKYRVQLGLDPLSRQKLRVATEEPDTTKDRFFERKK